MSRRPAAQGGQRTSRASLPAVAVHTMRRPAILQPAAQPQVSAVACMSAAGREAGARLAQGNMLLGHTCSPHPHHVPFAACMMSTPHIAQQATSSDMTIDSDRRSSPGSCRMQHEPRQHMHIACHCGGHQNASRHCDYRVFMPSVMCSAATMESQDCSLEMASACTASPSAMSAMPHRTTSCGGRCCVCSTRTETQLRQHKQLRQHQLRNIAILVLVAVAAGSASPGHPVARPE